MADDRIEIEVNGKTLEARPGQMLIEVTDAAGIYVPRFCYHEKLSIAANCRMCLIEVEGVAKPLPACATPVTPGMKVATRSPRAVSAQKATMEFLLINHPLDCPICDQGGECELQDLAMGFGRGVSRYTEGKRSVADMNLGPLVSTDMTRCIHCTRCVRFGQEIAGIQELGTIGRGESMEIGTYIQHTVDHELSGNIIDVCPVGALNNKPYRFSARAWEMSQHSIVSPHDCFGGNLYAHVLGNTIRRVVPRQNDALNETWAADRDRFSCEGLDSPDRALEPMIRRNGDLRSCSWGEALLAAADALRTAGGEAGALVSPSATTEEGYLLARIFGHLGSGNLDHRLRRRDFRLQEDDPVFPWLGMPIADVVTLDSVLLIGSNLRREVPLLAHRLRQAALGGASVSMLNPAAYEYLFPVRRRETDIDLPGALARLSNDEKLLAELSGEGRSAILLGQIAMHHPRFAELRALAGQIAIRTGAQLGYIPGGANSAGLSLAGVLPHREPAGKPRAQPGRHAGDMLECPPPALLMLGVEPEHDFAEPERAMAAWHSAGTSIALTPYLGDALQANADVLLPVAAFAETDGTFVNAAGDWQSYVAAVPPRGEARPAWKVLRVLGDLLGVPDWQFAHAGEIREAVAGTSAAIEPDNSLDNAEVPGTPPVTSNDENLDVPMYRIDALVRRAQCLQQTAEGRGVAVNGHLDEGAAA